jgi:hypothetical protein
VAHEDRRDGGWLGLVLLGWGLLVAPLLHGFGHDADNHHHRPAAPAQHGQGSLEHGLVAAIAPTPQTEWRPLLMAMVEQVPLVPVRPALKPRWVPLRGQAP